MSVAISNLFNQEDYFIAQKEGWRIYAVDSDSTCLQLQKLDEPDVFATDDDAWKFVIRQAIRGSALHQRAIKHIKDTCPAEYEKFVQDAEVVEVASLDKVCSTLINQPWILKLSNGNHVGFDAKDNAIYAQSIYRKAVSLTE